MKYFKTLFLFVIIIFIDHSSAIAQLKKVFVETYYISDSYDATDTIGGGIPTGSKTYRVYLQLEKGSKLQKIYGDVNHALIINSTENFFNNLSDGQTFGKDFNKNRLLENTVALDSWLTLGQTTKNAAKTYFGVPKTYDQSGSFIGGANNDGGSAGLTDGLLINEDTLAGLPLTIADGMDTMIVLPANWYDYGIITSGFDSTIFGSIVSGSHFISYNAGLQNDGVRGVNTDSNQVLVAQLTTLGEISFELNVEVLDTTNNVIRYVANDSILLTGEVCNRYLKYPFKQVCGCPDPRYLEYISDRDCNNNVLCKTLIKFGCMDSNACNFDPDANFNLTDVCCYPGRCNDRDMSIVCPSLLSNNRTFILFPNPVEGMLTLKNSREVKVGGKYIIYNAFGKIMEEGNIGNMKDGSTFNVDVSKYETGIFLFRLLRDGSAESNQFMKY